MQWLCSAKPVCGGAVDEGSVATREREDPLLFDEERFEEERNDGCASLTRPSPPRPRRVLARDDDFWVTQHSFSRTPRRCVFCERSFSSSSAYEMHYSNCPKRDPALISATRTFFRTVDTSDDDSVYSSAGTHRESEEEQQQQLAAAQRGVVEAAAELRESLRVSRGATATTTTTDKESLGLFLHVVDTTVPPGVSPSRPPRRSPSDRPVPRRRQSPPYRVPAAAGNRRAVQDPPPAAESSQDLDDDDDDDAKTTTTTTTTPNSWKTPRRPPEPESQMQASPPVPAGGPGEPEAATPQRRRPYPRTRSRRSSYLSADPE